MTNLFVDEALRADEHPGVVFRPGPTGRRAGLVGGPDIWEVIGTLRGVQHDVAELTGEALVMEVADALGLSVAKVRTAVRYYLAYPDDVDERITANEAEAATAEAAWLAEQALLRQPRRAAG